MVTDEEYINIAINVFEGLQRKYNLKLDAKNNVLNYSNTVCSFSVYFEKHFEFYICFHLNHIDLRLYDIAEWLGFDNRDIVSIIRNQIANENDAKFVLENIYAVLEKLLRVLQKKPELLYKFLKEKKKENGKLLLEVNLSLIQQAWEEKQFKRFLMLVDSNRSIIKQSKRALIIFKQEAYIKKTLGEKGQGGQGDGSVVPAGTDDEP